MAKYGFRLIESQKEIEKKIVDALYPQVVKFMDRFMDNIRDNLPPVIRQAIINTTEYDSLMSGKLKLEFGIPNPGEKLAGLIDIWSSNIRWRHGVRRLGNQIKAEVGASLIRVDFSDVLYTNYALVVDAARGYNLPWLEWLVLEGDKTIVKRHEVKFAASKYSRTGLAIMKESRKNWRVPPEFSGTINNNWITRAIDAASPKIYEIIEKAADI